MADPESAQSALEDSTEQAIRSAPARPRHRMVDRVAAILEAVARSGGGMTLTAVAKTLDAPVSSTQSLLNGLVATGFLDERERVYTLGTAPYLLNVLAGRPPVTNVSHEQLQAVHSEIGATVALATDVGDDLFYVDHVATDSNYAYLAENRLRRSLLRTSAGWLLLADREKRDIWSYLNSRSAADADARDRFLERLDEMRRTGVCIAPDVAVDGGDGVSVALRENGRTIATVGVIAEQEQIHEQADALVDVLLRHAASWGLRG